MRLKEFLIQEASEKDPHAWMQKAVDKILDAGNREELLKKGDRELVYLVQQAKSAGPLHFTSVAKLRGYIDAWRKKQEVKEGEVIQARFGAKGALQDTGIKVPPGYDRFKLDGKDIFGLRDGKWLKISRVSDEKLGQELVKAYNQGGKTDANLKPVSLMSAFGSEELAALDEAGIQLTEKPSYWEDFEEGGHAAKRNIHEVKLKKVEKTIGKLPVIDSTKIWGGPLKPKYPVSLVKMMPDEQMFIVKFGDGTRYLADRTGAEKYIRFWQKIV